MKRAAARASVLVVAAGLLAGCAQLAVLGPIGGVDRRQQAERLIAQGDLAEALVELRVLETLHPNDPEIAALRRSVEAEARRLADSHYEKAEAAAKRDRGAARKEYVAALAYDPEHEGALRRLRQLELQSNRSNRPRIGGPEAPTKMAVADVYMQMADQEAARPAPDDFPRPLAKPDPPAPPAPVAAAPATRETTGGAAQRQARDPAVAVARASRETANAAMAQQSLEQAIADVKSAGTYLNMIAYAESYLAEHPGDDDAVEMLALSHEKAGLALYRDGKLRQSLRHLEFAVRHTGDSDGPSARALAVVKTRLADQTYEQGVRAFRNDISQAIAYWEETLTYDPGHLKARDFLRKAYKIRETLNDISSP